MRTLQKLVRNGSSTQLTMPRPMLIHLGWLPGEAVIVEMHEEGYLVVRRPAHEDFAPKRMVRMDLQPAPEPSR